MQRIEKRINENSKNVYIRGAAKRSFLEVKMADSFYTISRADAPKKLPQGTGLLLAPCNSVHMCFMRFAIDVIYIDKEYKILKVVKNLKPWVGLSMCNNAWATLEMAAGEAERCGLKVGESFIISLHNLA